jgi:hypothetical protein
MDDRFDIHKAAAMEARRAVISGGGRSFSQYKPQ